MTRNLKIHSIRFIKSLRPVGNADRYSLPSGSDLPNIQTKNLWRFQPSAREALARSDSTVANDGDNQSDTQTNQEASIEHHFRQQLELIQIEMVNMRSQIFSMKQQSRGEIAIDPPLYDQVMEARKDLRPHEE